MNKKTKCILYLFIGLLFLPTLLPLRVHACSCAESLSPDEAFSTTEVVFRGKVMEIQETNGVRTGGKKEVLFEVLENWKGNDQSQLIIQTGLGHGDCGYPFVENAEYIVYANTSEMYGNRALVAITCSRTTMVQTGNAQEDLTSLGEGVASTEQVNLQKTLTNTKESLSGIQIVLFFVVAFISILTVAILIVSRRKVRQ